MEVQLLLVHISLFMTLWSLSYSATLGVSSSPSLAKPNCSTHCGDVEIPYPFGIGSNCHYPETKDDGGFQILCDNSTKPSKPFLNLTDSQPEVMEISLEEGTLKIKSPITFSGCPNKISDRQPPDLRNSSFWFSMKNRFTSVSCGRIASLKSLYGGAAAVCLSICDDYRGILVNNACGGVKCCQTTQGSKYPRYIRYILRYIPFSNYRYILGADWWAQWGYSAPNVSRIAMRILAQTASSSACERNWSTFALIHTKQWNRLAYQKLEKLVYCYYNMKLRLRDKRAKDNPMNENTYIDLLHVASEPLQNGIDPLHDWIMPAHLDDENGNPPPHVVEKASDFGIDVNRVLSEEVGDPGDDSDSVSVWGGVATPDSSDDDDDGGDGSGGGGGGGGGDTRFEYGQSYEGGRFEQFTCESNFDHATQDEDHGSRAGGHGAQQQDKYGRRTRVIDDDQSTPSDVASVALSFDSISIGTEHSGTSNESHEVNYQSGYPIHDYGKFGEVYDQSLSWIHPYYPILGETVGNSKDIYDYHVNHYNSYYMGRMSWAEYCTFADQRASFQAPRASFWY